MLFPGAVTVTDQATTTPRATKYWVRRGKKKNRYRGNLPKVVSVTITPGIRKESFLFQMT